MPHANHANLYLQFARNFDERPDATFLDTVEGHGYTFAEARSAAGQMATALRELGVTPGDRVAVQIDKSCETVILYLACLQVGAVYLPLNTAYTGEEIRYFLGDAGPHLYVCQPKVLETARALGKECDVPRVESLGTEQDGTLMEQARQCSASSEIVPRAADDLAAILYTSGTTGRSKGAMLTHANLASNCQALAETWRFTRDDHLIHALPIFHTHGLFVACNIVLTVGASMTFLPKFDAEQILDLMARSSVLMGVPTFYTRLLESERLNRETTAGMRLFVSGSAPLLSETHSEFSARTGHAILERYGMTETNMNTSNPYDGERRPGTVGMALPGSEVRITDRETGATLPRGETGLIEVRGANVFKGYWKMPEKTASEFREDGFFITGDLGHIDADGYLCISGRDKDLIISGGYNIYPKEVELLIDDMPGVNESAVFGVPHPDFGEGVCAVVVMQAGHQGSLDEAAVLAALSDKLARYKQPKRVFFIESLPRNVMGKVQKKQLREEYAQLFAPEPARSHG